MLKNVTVLTVYSGALPKSKCSLPGSVTSVNAGSPILLWQGGKLPCSHFANLL